MLDSFSRINITEDSFQRSAGACLDTVSASAVLLNITSDPVDEGKVSWRHAYAFSVARWQSANRKYIICDVKQAINLPEALNPSASSNKNKIFMIRNVATVL